MKAGSPDRVARRLVAILAADVVGYSRLMEIDEEGTARLLREHRAAAAPLVAHHAGRIVKTTGDGVLIEFPSVVGAVQCALALQNLMAKCNAGVPSERRMDWRVGIHLGDILIEGEDIVGEGVNLAPRLEGIAEPGGICISEDAFRQVRGKIEAEFFDTGEQSLKNIARPVRIFRARLASASVSPDATRTTLPLPDKPSIAILPFQNMSADAEQEYFVDGIVEEITTAIARLPWLFVIARNSSFTYKGKAVDVKQVARELGVRYVLEGSVRKAGNRVRITSQLIDTNTSAHIWADRFDGALDDIFDLQDRVAASVVGTIEPRLRLSEIERASRKPPESLNAYDLYLRALAQFHRYTDESFAETVSLLQQALAIDPSYSPAAALVGWCRVFQGVQGWGVLSDADISAAVHLARQALQAEHDDAETVVRAGFTLFYFAGETAMAKAALDRGLKLNPNLSAGWQATGMLHSLRNELELAIEASNRALRLSPCDPLGFFSAAPLRMLTSSPVASNRLSSGSIALCTPSRALAPRAELRLRPLRGLASSLRLAPNSADCWRLTPGRRSPGFARTPLGQRMNS